MSRQTGRGDASKAKVCVVGSNGAVGEALVAELEERGFDVVEIEREQAWRHDREGLDGVVLMCVDTSIWWEGEEEEALRAYRGWMERAYHAKVPQVLLVTSAATLGKGEHEEGIGELEAYVMGSGEAWEDRVWRMEGEAYGWMARGVRVWFALPTMVAQSARFHAMLEDGRGGGMRRGDVVSARDVARGCVQVLRRGRAGRRYVLGGEEVEWEGGAGGYLEGRKYVLEAASGELGYGVREDVSWVSRKERGVRR